MCHRSDWVFVGLESSDVHVFEKVRNILFATGEYTETEISFDARVCDQCPEIFFIGT